MPDDLWPDLAAAMVKEAGQPEEVANLLAIVYREFGGEFHQIGASREGLKKFRNGG